MKAKVNYNAYDTWLEPYIGWSFDVMKTTHHKVIFFMDGGHGKRIICSHQKRLFDLIEK